ncbi:Lecithin:cholesterol acyltransferase [Phellopilus nigrolimitatus]|nr:Lecithin:cholesterol acyltransferase [Phellopilus nigrolimitatus]
MPLRQRKTWFGRNEPEDATDSDDAAPTPIESGNPAAAGEVEVKAEKKAKEKLKNLALMLEQSQTDLGAFARNMAAAMPTLDIDWGRFDGEWEALKARIPEPWKLNNDGREFQVGERARDRGLHAHHPVVLVPGIISTGLESWSTSDEYRGWFREKVWGGLHMLSQVTFNRDKWMAAVLLDAETGLDPPGVKVRAAQGIDAASSFIQGYWIWSKIVENLAVVGYDTNNLLLAAYDWRLSYWNLEERDGYFSRLKASIEELRRREDKKVVLAAHSMGSSTYVRSFKWVESPRFGGGGPTWVEVRKLSSLSLSHTRLTINHNHRTTLRPMTAFLSGEMRDTVELNPTGAYVLERFFSRRERARLFRSWAGSASMWIKGGDAVWGNHTHAPDDSGNCTQSHGSFLSFRPSELLVLASDTKNMTAEESGTWILEHTPTSFQRMMATNFSCGIERDEKKLEMNDDNPTKWSNPLESRLPNAPSMKLHCIYGHGKETEYDETFADSENAMCENTSDCTSPRAPLDMPLSRKNWIDYEVNDEQSMQVKNGVKLGEGDGTVSLLSLGAMCVEGWKHERWNPGGVKVVTTELPHLPSLTIPRGGANTSDHVDILGSTGLNELIVKVATGAGEEIEIRSHRTGEDTTAVFDLTLLSMSYAIPSNGSGH